jgi:hypothetical protein
LGQISGNSVDISKAFFHMVIWKFESSQVSQAVRPSGVASYRPATGYIEAGPAAQSQIAAHPTGFDSVHVNGVGFEIAFKVMRADLNICLVA